MKHVFHLLVTIFQTWLIVLIWYHAHWSVALLLTYSLVHSAAKGAVQGYQDIQEMKRRGLL